MTIITGKNAIVDGAEGVGFWKIQHQSSDASVVHSGTECAVVRIAGNLDWRGVYQSYGHTPQAMPGDALSFIGEDSDGKGASGTAIVSRVDIHWDIFSARPIYLNVFFEANGALEIKTPDPRAAAAAYASPFPSKGMLTKWEGVTEPNVSSMMLSLISKNAKYNDSSTDGQILRVAGNKDVIWRYRRNIGDSDLQDLTTFPAVDSFARLRFYVTATLFWDLQDAVVKQVVPIYDIEGGRDHQLKVASAVVMGKLGIDPSDATHNVAEPDGTKWIDFTD